MAKNWRELMTVNDDIIIAQLRRIHKMCIKEDFESYIDNFMSENFEDKERLEHILRPFCLIIDVLNMTDSKPSWEM